MQMARSALQHFPPMGIYEVLFSFLDATGSYLGTEQTHPWAQGFPLTTRLPGGPALPSHVEFSPAEMKYPPATGAPELLAAIQRYYTHFYGAKINTDNIAVFAGGRPAIFAALSFLRPEYRVLIEETEYTPYYDVLKLLNRDPILIPSNEGNSFRPSIEDYRDKAQACLAPKFVVKSNPCNPTGVTWTGSDLEALVDFCSQAENGGLIDEAYEFFHEPEPDSALRYIKDIDRSNVFVVGAATKGLQVPGMRIGWVVASKQNIELFRNFSSLGMGGVSRASQIYVARLLELQRARQARMAVAAYFGAQRERYRQLFETLGFKLFTGDGGFYHWARLPDELTAAEFNRRLFKSNAAILPGYLCDMHRRGNEGPLGRLVRFSFGATPAEDFEGSAAILQACLETQIA
jgi:aminotransferase